MTIADEAVTNAIPCELVKYALRQSKDGIVISFVVHPNDIPAALQTSHIGSRWMAALVQIGDDEKPIPQRKEASPAPRQDVKPRQTDGGKERMDWREVQPSAQSGIRANDVKFQAFLREEMEFPEVTDAESAAMAIRHICHVHSRAEFSTNHKKRVLWHQLDSRYSAWEAKERVGT